MARMGEVLKKSDEAEKRQDLIILNGILQKDKEAAEAERRKKEAFLKLNREINQTLANQVQEK